MGQALLIDSPPQIMLLAIDLHEDFIDVEGIAEASVLTLQPARINGTELDAPQAYRFAGNGDAPLCQKIFNIPMAKIKAVVESNSVGNDVRRESVAFVGIHWPILTIRAS